MTATAAASVRDLSRLSLSPTYFNVIARCLQIFFILAFLGGGVSADAAGLETGSVHRLVFHDVDGNDLSTADGHVTVITVITREKEAEAHAVADRVPNRYKGDRKYRYITMVNFQGKLFGVVQGLTRAVIRRRLEAEANELRPDYAARKVGHDPRGDLYVIADFEGQAVQKLCLPVSGNTIAVFVFNGAGKLVARWNEVPPDDSLAKAIAAAG